MKKFNRMTEKQMENIGGGGITVLVLMLLSLVVAPLGIGGSIGYGAYESTKHK